MEYHKNSGPQIKVDFFIKGHKIAKVHLSNSLKMGTLWEIFSDEKCSDLEKLIGQWMEEYCKGKHPSVGLPVNLDSLPLFTKRALEQLSNLPYGKAMSYMELATSINKPQAARAVGNACGRNPLPLIIPCHRVLAKYQKLGGFSGGLSIKKKLLKHEGIFFT